MNRGGEKKAFPLERGLAWIVTVLLTLFITAAILCTLSVQLLTSESLHTAIATGDAVVNSEIRYIHEKIDEMAAEYGFSAERMKEVVGKEEIRRINRETASWWTALLTEGKTEEAPRWYSSQVEEILYETMPEENRKEDPQTIASDLMDMVERTVFPLRETLISTGMSYVQEKADIVSLVRTMRGLPLISLMCCLAAAGAVALLMGREIFRSLKYYGSALAGAGFAIISTIVIILLLRPAEFIAEASRPLMIELETVAGRIFMAAGAIVAILLAAGYICLVKYRNRKTKKTSVSERAA
jgi:hypothetical protein